MQSSLLPPLTLVPRRIFTRQLQGRFITVPYKNLSADGLFLCRISSATTIPLHRQTCFLQPTSPAGIQLIVILIDNNTFVKCELDFYQNSNIATPYGGSSYAKENGLPSHSFFTPLYTKGLSSPFPPYFTSSLFIISLYCFLRGTPTR